MSFLARHNPLVIVPIAILILAVSAGVGERYSVRFRALPQEGAAQPRSPLVVGLAVTGRRLATLLLP